MRIRIRRRGGLAGVTLRADVDTAELESATAARVEGALARLLTTAGPVSTPHPDAFEYEIGIPDRGEAVSFGEHDVPADLQPLVELVARDGSPERRGE
ncbi:MAG: hypothetical protein M3018_01740 [Actinomycetota bacterium]|nr:hypothetical protein [Actinomycetota bacterium]